MKLVDLTGKVFGRLTVIHRGQTVATSGGQKKTVWHCKCSCGKEIDVVYQQLIRGKTHSCGCYNSDIVKARLTKHGGAGTRLYNIWLHMRARCFNTADAAYKDYGGRGILVCKEWNSSFEAFKEWALGSGYADNLSIDRIDNNAGYYPENCRWVTAKEQSNNRRSNKVLTHNSESHTMAEWAVLTGIKYGKIQEGISAGKTLTQIIQEQTEKAED